MRLPVLDQRHTHLLPEGKRWGFGAHSVLPYLARMLEERPGEQAQSPATIRNPVFPHMEQTLRSLDRTTRHVS